MYPSLHSTTKTRSSAKYSSLLVAGQNISAPTWEKTIIFYSSAATPTNAYPHIRWYPGNLLGHLETGTVHGVKYEIPLYELKL